VTGRLAAAGIELVDRAFQQVPEGRDLPDEAGVVPQQTEKNPALAAGLIESGRVKGAPNFMFIHMLTKR
jgi:hypothetical protein